MRGIYRITIGDHLEDALSNKEQVDSSEYTARAPDVVLPIHDLKCLE